MSSAPDFQSMYTDRVRAHGDSFRANGHTPLAFSLRRRLYRYVLTRRLPPAVGQRPVTFLDSGCGNGCLGPFFRSFLNITRLAGVDFVADACRIARTRFGYDETKTGDVLSLGSLFTETFDVVNSCEVFLYIAPEKRPDFWRAHLARLKPGGVMIMLVPNLRCVWRKVKPISATFGYPFDLGVLLENVRQLESVRLEHVCGVNLFTRTTFDFDASRRQPLKELLSFELALVLSHVPAG